MSLDHSSPIRPAVQTALSGGEPRADTASVAATHRAGTSRLAPVLLRGRRVAIICESDDNRDAGLVCRAAEDLGAQVARIRPDLGREADAGPTARLLSRLYDAVDCEGLSAAMVRQLQDYSGIPVFDNLSADPQAETRGHGRRLGTSGEEMRRRLAIQAKLLSALT